jgi:integrase
MKGYIEKRGERIYRLRVDLGADTTGKRIQKSVTVHGSRKDAERKLTQLLTEVQQKTCVNTGPMTLATYLDYWLANYARRLAARTYENYREYVEYYIKPDIGNLRLDQLQSTDIQAFYTRLERAGRKRTGPPLSPTTVFNTHRALRGALRQAVRWQLLGRNPVDIVTPPRPAERPQRVLTQAEVATLLVGAQQVGSRLFIPVLIGLGTGMRRGEICGLRWQDVNMERSVLAIRQTLVSVGRKRLEFKTPKTATGRRSVRLPDMLVQALRQEQTRQEEMRSLLGPAYNSRNLVVCREDGTPLHPATLYSTFQDLLVRLGLPRVAIHDLRHFHATRLLEEGVHPKVVSERLGHADPSLTLRVYSHVLEDIQQQAADQTGVFLRKMLKPNQPQQTGNQEIPSGEEPSDEQQSTGENQS